MCRLESAFGQQATQEKYFLDSISVQMPWKGSRNGAGKRGIKTQCRPREELDKKVQPIWNLGIGLED